ncbi:multidrug resistance protein, MFS family [Legionella birminghamensis]|uniref:Multidrug resistance protein, MFS family n=1 Tax=Legionella birminghamensis TaxID=28083 RepID=A0A378ICG3_9GAMM|nr:MFS transporter [Legionella birminghamensis]KTC66768.1 multidrug resistance protein, MFS family [Legionella birminghamensis]STX32917.1 multidrug resistance protein, MFS family [Legionella birminghamensis]
MSYCLLTRKLLLIYAIQSTCGGTAFYISLFLSGYSHLNPAQIGLALSFGSVGNIAGGYIGGYLCDKYNASYNLKFGLLIQGSALFLLVFLQQFKFILISMMLMGFGSYLYVTSSNFILNSKFNRDQNSRTKIISDQHIISNIGMFCAAILMGYSTDGYYKIIFTCIAFTIITVGITLRPFAKNDFETKFDSHIQLQDLAAKNYIYLLGIITIGVVGLMFAAHRIGLPIYLNANFGNINTGFLMALNPLIILFFQRRIIRYSSNNEFIAIVIGLILFAFSFLILNCSATVFIVIFSTILLTIGEILTVTHAQSIAFGYAPKNSKGKIMGLYKAMYSITKVFGSYYSGIIIYNLGYVYLWSISSYLGFMGCFIALIYFFKHKHLNYFGAVGEPNTSTKKF